MKSSLKRVQTFFLNDKRSIIKTESSRSDSQREKKGLEPSARDEGHTGRGDDASQRRSTFSGIESDTESLTELYSDDTVVQEVGPIFDNHYEESFLNRIREKKQFLSFQKTHFYTDYEKSC